MTLEEAKLLARTSDPDWLGEELFRLQELLPGDDVMRGLRFMLNHLDQSRGWIDWNSDFEAAYYWIRRGE